MQYFGKDSLKEADHLEDTVGRWENNIETDLK
jgi:hypothetical protein